MLEFTHKMPFSDWTCVSLSLSNNMNLAGNFVKSDERPEFLAVPARTTAQVAVLVYPHVDMLKTVSL